MRDIVFIGLLVADVILCCGLVATILMQSKKSAGMTGTISGAGASQTYWDKNKGRSLEGMLEKYTKIIAALFILVGIALNILS